MPVSCGGSPIGGCECPKPIGQPQNGSGRLPLGKIEGLRQGLWTKLGTLIPIPTITGGFGRAFSTFFSPVGGYECPKPTGTPQKGGGRLPMGKIEGSMASHYVGCGCFCTQTFHQVVFYSCQYRVVEVQVVDVSVPNPLDNPRMVVGGYLWAK